jgi:hypothetical protein
MKKSTPAANPDAYVAGLNGGPVLLIRAEEQRVLLGFWRGQRLRAIEPGLKPGGKYEMATLELSEGMPVSVPTVRRLTRKAVALNKGLGDPTHIAGPDKLSRPKPPRGSA